MSRLMYDEKYRRISLMYLQGWAFQFIHFINCNKFYLRNKKLNFRVEQQILSSVYKSKIVRKIKFFKEMCSIIGMFKFLVSENDDVIIITYLNNYHK